MGEFRKLMSSGKPIMIRIPILVYHVIDTNDEPFISNDKGELIYVSGLEEFQWQMKYISDNGHNVLLLDDYVAFVMNLGGARLHPDLLENSVIITFDDGHISNYTLAFPVLQKHGFAATFFVKVEGTGFPNRASFDQLREMADKGMSIQSHTMTHPFLPDLSNQGIRRELQESKSILEGELGRKVDYLALPGGRYSPKVKNIAVEVGYKAVCTSIIGYNDLDSDPYSLKRWSITKDTDHATFESIIDKRFSVFAHYKTKYLILGGLKKILGNRRYVAIREKLL